MWFLGVVGGVRGRPFPVFLPVYSWDIPRVKLGPRDVRVITGLDLTWSHLLECSAGPDQFQPAHAALCLDNCVSSEMWSNSGHVHLLNWEFNVPEKPLPLPKSSFLYPLLNVSGVYLSAYYLSTLILLSPSLSFLCLDKFIPEFTVHPLIFAFFVDFFLLNRLL